jgi:membrane fusion protein (multidrug efflux system)
VKAGERVVVDGAIRVSSDAHIKVVSAAPGAPGTPAAPAATLAQTRPASVSP